MRILAGSPEVDMGIRFSRHSYLRFLAGIVLSAIALSGYAQDNVGDDSTILYPFSYFAQFAPRTALDMLNRIPGMTMSSGSSRRSSSGRGGSGGSFTNRSRGGRGLGGGITRLALPVVALFDML